MTTGPFHPCIDPGTSLRADARDTAPRPSESAESPELACCDVALDPAVYTDLIGRLSERLTEEEARAGRDRDRGAALFRDLMKIPAESREETIFRDRRFASFALADRLLDAAEDRVDAEPDDAVDMVELALAVSSRLEGASWRRSLLADLEARAWALLGEGWCRLDSPAASRTAFRLARTRLRRGSGDPLQEADLLFHQAAPLCDTDPSAALSRADRAAALFLEYGDQRRLGESLARKGRLTARSGDHRTAAGVLREALALLDGSGTERRQAEVGWLLARSLLAQGAADEAWTEIARARTKLRKVPDPLLEARLRFLEGRIAQLAGLVDQAEAGFRDATDALLGLGKADEAARAHLARIAVEQEAAGSVRSDAPGDARSTPEPLAPETDRLLTAGGLSRETTMALLLVDRAADAGTLRPDLVSALNDFLERSG